MIRTVLTVAAVALALGVLYAARNALMLIYVSALIAMGFSPLVRVIERSRADGSRRRIPRGLAILAVYMVVLTLLVLVGLAVIPPLIDQAGELWARLPQEFNRLERFLIRHGLMTHRITLQEAVENAPAGSGANAVNTVLLAIWSFGGGVFGVFTVLILSFYLLVEAESLFNYATRFVPAGRRAAFTAASREAVMKVSAWLRAQLVLAGVMGVCAAVGLALMRVPYFFVIALVAAIGETIPIVGPIIGGMTAVVIALGVSPKLALAVGGYFFVLHQLEANILVPKIMERRVGISPVTVIIALLMGGALWGLVGAILAVPTAAILSVVIEELAASTVVGSDVAGVDDLAVNTLSPRDV
jgi:predicted PurR-regulated permease PerM